MIKRIQYVYCLSLVATQALSFNCRAFIEYHDSREKLPKPSHRAIFSEHPVNYVSQQRGFFYAVHPYSLFCSSLDPIILPSSFTHSLAHFGFNLNSARFEVNRKFLGAEQPLCSSLCKYIRCNSTERHCSLEHFFLSHPSPFDLQFVKTPLLLML